jgi:hypothetical protein
MGMEQWWHVRGYQKKLGDTPASIPLHLTRISHEGTFSNSGPPRREADSTRSSNLHLCRKFLIRIQHLFLSASKVYNISVSIGLLFIPVKLAYFTWNQSSKFSVTKRLLYIMGN